MIKKVKSFLFENKTAKQTIAKNTFWLFFGQIASRFLRVAIIIYAARILGAQEWGAFNYVLSIAAFLTIFTDFGVNAVLTRESVKKPELQEKYFSTTFFIKFLVSVLVFVLFIFLFPLVAPYITSSVDDLSLVKILVPIIAFVVLFDSFRDFGTSLARVKEKMEIESFVQIITNTLILAAGFVALYYLPGARSLAIAYAIGTGVGAVFAFVPFRHYFKNFFSNFTPSLIKKILLSSWPFGLMSLMGAIMLNTDSIMIAWLKNIEQVGFYSAGQRIAQFLYVVPALVAAAFFPQIARASEEKEKFKNLLEKSVSALWLLAIPLSIGGVLLSKEIIQLLYGDSYLSGTTAFFIMNLTYLPIFLSASLGNALFALHREKELLKYVLLAAFGNFFFNLLFIPTLGIAGSALSTLINQILSTGYLIYILKKSVSFSIGQNSKKMFLAGLFMALIVGLFNFIFHLPVILTIIAGAIAYAGALLGLKEPFAVEALSAIRNKF